MVRSLLQYNVFIASPGNLDAERNAFKDSLTKFSNTHSEKRGLIFKPIGWESMLKGAGRPQSIINETALRLCDYAVFVLHDRWGSPSSSIYTSGVQEEFAIAEEMHRTSQMKDIIIFFKDVPKNQLADPGEQLRNVLSFKEKIISERKHFFETFSDIISFSLKIEGYLSQWSDNHEPAQIVSTQAVNEEFEYKGDSLVGVNVAADVEDPPFDYWINQLNKLSNDKVKKPIEAIFCAEKAALVSNNDVEWAQAEDFRATAHIQIGTMDVSLSICDSILEKLNDVKTPEAEYLKIKAFFNKGVVFGLSGRRLEEIAIYDTIRSQFTHDLNVSSRIVIGRSLFNKVSALTSLERNEEAIEVYDHIINISKDSEELEIKWQGGRAILSKGGLLRRMSRLKEAIAVFEGLQDFFANETQFRLKELIIQSFISVSMALVELNNYTEAMDKINEVIESFVGETEPKIQSVIILAMLQRVSIVKVTQRHKVIIYLERIINNYSSSLNLEVQESVAKSITTKALFFLEESQYDEVIKTFTEINFLYGSSKDVSICSRVAHVALMCVTSYGICKKYQEGLDLANETLGKFSVYLFDDTINEYMNKLSLMLPDLSKKAKFSHKERKST